MARVNAGLFKGLNLKAPLGVRPTESKVRQAIFNILGSAVSGCRFLDGFAGSGALGIEALSRGAAFSAFIESDTEAVLTIRENLEKLAPDVSREAWRIVHMPVARGLAVLAESEAPFDFILFDPPYASSDGKKALNALGQHAILAPAGIVGLEHDRRTEMPTTIGSLSQWKQHRYGDTVLSLFRQL